MAALPRAAPLPVSVFQISIEESEAALPRVSRGIFVRGPSGAVEAMLRAGILVKFMGTSLGSQNRVELDCLPDRDSGIGVSVQA